MSDGNSFVEDFIKNIFFLIDLGGSGAKFKLEDLLIILLLIDFRDVGTLEMVLDVFRSGNLIAIHELALNFTHFNPYWDERSNTEFYRKSVESINKSLDDERFANIENVLIDVSYLNFNDTEFRKNIVKFTQKTWITRHDNKVRPSHAALDGMTIPIDERFPNGLMFPFDGIDRNLSEILGCRCTLNFS